MKCKLVRRCARRTVLCGAALVAVAQLPIPAAGATVVTFGAPLSRAPNTAFDCTRYPLGNGGTNPVYGDSSSCVWTTATNPLAPSEGLLTPAGTGTIRTIRIRVGPRTGAMQIDVLTVEVDSENGKVSCCTAAFVSRSFTPAANSITTLRASLPVHTDAPGQQSSPPLEVGDILALSILEDGVPIPAIDDTGAGIPAYQLPTGDVHYPAYAQGETDVMSGTFGYQLDMNADWYSGLSSTRPTSQAARKLTVERGTVGAGLNQSRGHATTLLSGSVLPPFVDAVGAAVDGLAGQVVARLREVI
jgi:hypothetical protein